MVENSPSSELHSEQHNSLSSDNHQLPTEFPYDFASFTSPTEDDEDDFFSGLTRQFALSTLLDSNKLQYAASQTQKEWSLSSSPQSIPSPVFSSGSPTGPLKGPSSPTAPFAPNDRSWELIREAAGQANIWNKLRTQQSLITDRSLLSSANNFTQTQSARPNPCFYNHNNSAKCCGSIWACQKRTPYGCENGGAFVSCANPQALCNVNEFMGDDCSLFSGCRKNVPGNVGGGVKRKCAGTGVFLPRTGPNLVESRVKSGSSTGLTQQQRAAEAMINMKLDNLMLNNAEAQSRFLDIAPNHDVMVMRRNAALAQQWKMMAAANRAMNYETHLPQEWYY